MERLLYVDKTLQLTDPTFFTLAFYVVDEQRMMGGRRDVTLITKRVKSDELASTLKLIKHDYPDAKVELYVNDLRIALGEIKCVI